jgi:hypothetical protein
MIMEHEQKKTKAHQAWAPPDSKHDGCFTART